MTNRYICTVLDEMRTCIKTLNFSYLDSLIEEAQNMANRMESSLYDKNDYESIKKRVKAKKKELDRITKKLEKARDNEEPQ